ncbi:MAG: hypothetical protein J7518_06025 [Nocardioidaceae bacterium]|nr:hypothetical protein [Nocardioidaceae bacterium]
MWDPDNFPGADNVPWQLLIRARFVHELDAVIASTVVHHVAAVASVDATRTVAGAAQKAIAHASREQASPEQRVAAFDAAMDFDDWCPTRPRPWPWPGPRRDFAELADPIADLVITKAAELVKVGGSEALQQTLGAALAEVAG